jgi:hypothetical protein
MMARIAIFVSFTLFATSVLAQGERRAIFGVGVSSCGAWTQARQARSNSGVLGTTQWAAGYLSGLNTEPAAPDALDGTDFDGIMGWIDNYCQTHPLIKSPTQLLRL